MHKDAKARNAVEHTEKPIPAGTKSGNTGQAADNLPAGPHSKEHLIDRDKTPGSGTLPGEQDGPNVDAGTG
ncbi:hypothetical protein HGO34_09095 [Agrobacterium vitis]|uniref:Uncharacterized protein n=1 Tax=Agrobacterium vitis TaxID=373 RepID=A0AAE4WBU3_AGRVI|nr:hypothetical protein [Agrobacterium vitis]MCF1496797.1 hypothetical protein [Allorhizobium sp. Av2]MCM2439873.1 hypothetical protein [Agrobacterium vitis]MUZ57230.1 hypothetical protein [Agrobacterium vitis]MVA65539.1 hypothetical protein [Agrobacterium vitis]MVA86564.1 hypothetical protein [Agrobacterium vitis]